MGLVFLDGLLDVFLGHAHPTEYFFNNDVVEARVELITRFLSSSNAEYTSDILLRARRRVDLCIFEGLFHLEQ